jgi:hypothetical protein
MKIRNALAASLLLLALSAEVVAQRTGPAQTTDV